MPRKKQTPRKALAALKRKREEQAAIGAGSVLHVVSVNERDARAKKRRLQVPVEIDTSGAHEDGPVEMPVPRKVGEAPTSSEEEEYSFASEVEDDIEMLSSSSEAKDSDEDEEDMDTCRKCTLTHYRRFTAHEASDGESLCVWCYALLGLECVMGCWDHEDQRIKLDALSSPRLTPAQIMRLV